MPGVFRVKLGVAALAFCVFAGRENRCAAAEYQVSAHASTAAQAEANSFIQFPSGGPHQSPFIDDTDESQSDLYDNINLSNSLKSVSQTLAVTDLSISNPVAAAINRWDVVNGFGYLSTYGYISANARSVPLEPSPGIKLYRNSTAEGHTYALATIRGGRIDSSATFTYLWGAFGNDSSVAINNVIVSNSANAGRTNQMGINASAVTSARGDAGAIGETFIRNLGASAAVVIWGINSLPGESRDSTFDARFEPASSLNRSAEEIESSNAQSQTVVLPVFESYGHDAPIYIEVDPVSTLHVKIDGNFISQLWLPEMTGPFFRISFDDIAFDVDSSQPVNFASYVPGGVDEFTLYNFGSIPNSLVLAMQFNSEGAAAVTIAAIPELSGSLLIGLCIGAMTVVQSIKKLKRVS